MAQFQQTIDMQTLQAAAGRNSLVNDLASRRVYDNAVEELNARSRRPKVHFSKAVSTEQTLIATNAYPEFEISFTHTQSAVHSLAGGLRSLELEYLMMQVPFGSLTYDIGGNFSAHLFKGRDYVHCCMPNLDVRDIARHEDTRKLFKATLIVWRGSDDLCLNIREQRSTTTQRIHVSFIVTVLSNSVN
jgi:hypothetical protein